MENQPIVNPSDTPSTTSTTRNQPFIHPQTKTSLFIPILITFLLSAVLFGFGGYFLGKQNVITITSINSPSPTPLLSSPTPNPKKSWETFVTSSGNFSFQHPTNVEIEDYGGAVTIRKSGSALQGQTEVDDGIILNITASSYEPYETSTFTTTLRDVAEQNLELSKKNADILEPLKPISIGSLSGYTYTTQGLGKSRHYILGTDKDTRILLIEDGTIDPRGQGYDTIVSQIINSIKMPTASDF